MLNYLVVAGITWGILSAVGLVITFGMAAYNGIKIKKTHSK